MRLQVVGCSGSIPGPASAASCYLVRADGYSLLLDLGSGALGPLQAAVDLDTVDAVWLSHLHADHCADMCAFYVARRYGRGHRTDPVVVLGPAGTAEHLDRAYGGPGDGAAMRAVFSFATVGPDPVRLGPFTLTAAAGAHPVTAHAVRVEADGRSLVYTGDTGPCDAVTVLARGADLLLAEASLREDEPVVPDLHLSGSLAGRLAADASVGRLVVTHVPPWNDPAAALAAAAAAFGGPVQLAVAGLALTV